MLYITGAEESGASHHVRTAKPAVAAVGAVRDAFDGLQFIAIQSPGFEAELVGAQGVQL